MFCQGRWLRSIREYRSLPWLMFKHGWCFSAVYVSMHAMFQHSKIKTLSKNSVLLEIRVLSAWLQGVQNKWNILLHAFFFIYGQNWTNDRSKFFIWMSSIRLKHQHWLSGQCRVWNAQLHINQSWNAILVLHRVRASLEEQNFSHK